MVKNKVSNDEEQLRHALRKLHALFDGIDEPIYISDPQNYEILFANKKFKEMAGKEVSGEKCYKVSQNLDKPCAFCTNRFIFGENLGKTHIWEHQNLRNRRTYKCIDRAIQWLGDKNVRLEIAIDITEHKKAQEKLIRLSNAVKMSTDGIVVSDSEAKIVDVNEAVLQMYGTNDKKDLVGKNSFDFIAPEDRNKALAGMKEVLEKGYNKSIKYRIVTKDRGKIPVEMNSAVIKDVDGKPAGFVGVVHNITDRVQAEEALRRSEEKFRNIFENVSDAIICLDRSGRILDFNRKAVEMFGGSREEALGKHFAEVGVFPPGDLPKVMRAFAELLANKPAALDVCIKSKKGRKMHLSCLGSFMKADDKCASFLVVARDITERRKAEDALRESEDLFRSVVENSHDGIVIIDDNFRIVYANDEVARLSGHSQEDIIGQDFRDFLGEESKSLLKRRYLRRQKGEREPSTYELRIVRKDGEKRDVKIKSIVLGDTQGRMRTISQVLDITELKKVEKERERFEERLSALNKYGQSLNMAGSLEEIYRVTLKAMERTLGFEYAAFIVIEGGLLYPAVYCGYPERLDFRLPLDGQKGVTVKAARTGKTIYVPDVIKGGLYVAAGVKGMRSELAVPVKVGNSVLGVLNVESTRLSAFDEDDRSLLEILASHAAIAISNLGKQDELKKMSNKIKYLMRSTTQIMNVENMNQRLKIIIKAIRRFGWRRVVISLRDENLEGTDLVTAGLTREEMKLLLERKAAGCVWRERLGPKFERFKIGEFYYLPWNDPWIREYVHGVPPEASVEEATTYAGVPSRLSPDEMVDWHPQDMLYAPLRTPEGRIVGILSMDDPLDGRKPTRESVAPLELFLYQAAMVIENAQLIQNLRKARKQLEEYAEQLEQKVEERTRELKKSQEQLLKAQRLAVIGELAGMVGHDLRNPLTSINGAAYYLKKRLSPKIDHKMKEMLDLIEKNIVYSNKIINDLLDYSREIKLDLTLSNPKSIIKEALSLVEIPKSVRVLDFTKNKPKIKIDLEKTKRAFINIIKNAVEAMPKGGTLTIRGKKLDNSLEFAFSDTGIGMSKKTMKKLWTPLFTTKAKGMGFGLAICKRIIEAHGGSICAKSALGKGTTFMVTIPTKPKIEGGEKVWVKPLESSLLTTTRT